MNFKRLPDGFVETEKMAIMRSLCESLMKIYKYDSPLKQSIVIRHLPHLVLCEHWSDKGKTGSPGDLIL